MPERKSLETAILIRLIIPLILFISLESVLSYFVTLHYVDKTYDRWLLDSARAIAQEIKVRGAKIQVELPPAAQEIVKWDDLDKTYFKISSPDNSLLAGDSIVPNPPEPVDWTNPVFFKSTIKDEPVRIVSMRIEKSEIHGNDAFFVHVAETLNKRREMMRDILLSDLIPQIVMMLVASLFLLLGLKRGLKPLHDLAGEIGKRSPRDLSPISEKYTFKEVLGLTNTINDLFTRLAQAIASQQRFVANAAHQLRTPLAGFVVQAERALREDEGKSIKPALKQMQASADRLSHTVTQLLVLAKSEPVDGMNEFKPVDLYLLVKAICIEWVPKALQKEIELSLECDENPVVINGDEALLQELLANLLDNAITYSGKHSHIAVKLISGPTPALIIEDDGPGIPEKEKARIFERFYRIPGSPGSGCGLGLAIVKEIADLHQADLELMSKHHDSGTRVLIVFKKIAGKNG